MLESLGVGRVAAGAGAVAIQWVMKDGIAEIGKILFIQSYACSFGIEWLIYIERLFPKDSHPKTWKAIGKYPPIETAYH